MHSHVARGTPQDFILFLLISTIFARGTPFGFIWISLASHLFWKGYVSPRISLTSKVWRPYCNGCPLGFTWICIYSASGCLPPWDIIYFFRICIRLQMVPLRIHLDLHLLCKDCTLGFHRVPVHSHTFWKGYPLKPIWLSLDSQLFCRGCPLGSPRTAWNSHLFARGTPQHWFGFRWICIYFATL
jgi:hypothetical protein